jgi:hypothetical protein
LLSQPYCQACLLITLNILNFTQYLRQAFRVPSNSRPQSWFPSRPVILPKPTTAVLVGLDQCY